MIDLWTAMAGTTDSDHLDPDSDIPIGEAYRLALQWVDDTLREIDGYYPRDMWPDPSTEQTEALHGFAPSIGLKDGSPFHVAGIRHALALVRTSSSSVPGSDG